MNRKNSCPFLKYLYQNIVSIKISKKHRRLFVNTTTSYIHILFQYSSNNNLLLYMISNDKARQYIIHFVSFFLVYLYYSYSFGSNSFFYSNIYLFCLEQNLQIPQKKIIENNLRFLITYLCDMMNFLKRCFSMSVCVRMCVHKSEAFALLLEKRTIRKVNATIETGQFWIDETQAKMCSSFVFVLLPLLYSFLYLLYHFINLLF